MGREYTLGKTAENMKETTKMTKNMGLAHIIGVMEEGMLDNGKKASSMEKECTYQQMVPKEKDFGTKGNESDG